MKIRVLQHVPFEGPGMIETWCARQGHDITVSYVYQGQMPPPEEVDGLVVMGGPMGVHDEVKYPWLLPEKQFIENTLLDGKPVLGICLGAQLVASVMGADVYPATHKEIGWFPVHIYDNAFNNPLIKDWPGEIYPLHWHGDMFDVPEETVALGYSEGCGNQGFLKDAQVAGLQFHLESTETALEALLQNCGDEITEGPYMQPAAEIRAGYAYLPETNRLMESLLNNLFGHD